MEFAWSVRMQQIREYTNRSNSLLYLSTGLLCCRQAPMAVNKPESQVLYRLAQSVDMPINARPLSDFQIEFKVSFWPEFKMFGFLVFHKLCGYIKRVIILYWFYLVVDYFNKIYLLFCFENVDNCWTSLNLYSHFLPFDFFCSCN